MFPNLRLTIQVTISVYLLFVCCAIKHIASEAVTRAIGYLKISVLPTTGAQ